MTEAMETTHLSIKDQVETTPREGGIYTTSTLHDTFHLRRWTEKGGWQASGGWTGCPDPGVIRRLTEGPMLRPSREEPKQPGAIVREFVTGDIYVRTIDGRWVCEHSEARWPHIGYPEVLSWGTAVSS